MALTGSEPISAANLKAALDALRNELEGGVPKPIDAWPIGMVVATSEGNPQSYIGGSWQYMGDWYVTDRNVQCSAYKRVG